MRLAYSFICVIALGLGCQPKTENQHHLAPPVKKEFPNTLVKKQFKTERLIGLTTDQLDYPLGDFPLKDTAAIYGWVGNTVNFVDSVHFVSAYHAWCGNDCFTTVYGRYYFVDSLKVRFYTDSIARSGDCEAQTEDTRDRPALDLYLVKNKKGRFVGLERQLRQSVLSK